MGRIEGGVSHEALVHELARSRFFWAGWLEIGSSVVLTPSGPLINFTDKTSNIAEIRRRLGGSVTLEKNSPSAAIRFSGPIALEIASSVGPLSPSRRKIYQYFLEWQKAPVERKKTVVEMAKGFEHWPVTQEDYHYLVDEVQFVAGVLSARGSYKSDRLTVGSINRALLEALARRYGGRVTPIEPSLKSRRNNWNLPVGPAHALIAMVMGNDLFCQMRSRDVARWEQRVNL